MKITAGINGQVSQVECDCEDGGFAVVIDAQNNARARCLKCGEEGEAIPADKPGDWLR